MRDTTMRFLARKTFVFGSGFNFTDAMCLTIATVVCVPTRHLGLDWYDQLQTVILYEGDFVPIRPYRSGSGVVRDKGPGLNGEAWLCGSGILSRHAVLKTVPHARHRKAGNVVIYELAHKLDMLRSGADGAPLTHQDMKPGEWHDIFTAA